MPYIDLSDVRCYFEQMGDGDPLLLIPGLGRTCRIWDCVAPQLAESFTLIMPDNRGMGRSEGKRAPRTLRELAVDLVELMDALQLDRAHVLGISLGSVIAQRLAVEHAPRVDKLVLVSTAHHFGPYLREMAHLIGHALRYFPRDVFERTVEILGSSPQFIDTYPQWIPENVAMKKEAKLSRSSVARQLLCLAATDSEDDEFRIDAPTLIIAGDQDALIPACYGQQIAGEIPGSEFVLLPACGHNPFIEAPQVVVSKIVEFLNRREPEALALGGTSWRSSCVDR